MVWRIEFHPRAEKEICKLDREMARRTLRFLRDRVAPLEDPRSIGDALKGVDLRQKLALGRSIIRQEFS